MKLLIRSIALVSALAAVPAIAGPCHDQPNMAAALEALRNAKGALERAEHNKGGWRERAVEATTHAIKETEKGCEVADKH
jgi:hypothetical protein